MTRSTRIYGKVALLMAGILAASVLLTLAVGVDRRPAGKTRIVASFYPVYIAALNLADGVEGVEVVKKVEGPIEEPKTEEEKKLFPILDAMGIEHVDVGGRSDA